MHSLFAEHQNEFWGGETFKNVFMISIDYDMRLKVFVLSKIVPLISLYTSYFGLDHC